MSAPSGVGPGEAQPQVAWRLWEQRDLDQIMELEPVLFGEDAWPRDGFEVEMFQPQTREYWVAESTAPGEEGKLLAYGGAMVIPPIGDIQTVGVVPSAQGQGLGRALMGHLISACIRRSAESVMLEVRQSNAPAIGLYRSMGFEQIHVRPNYYRGGESALIMRLMLPASAQTKDHEERA